MTSQVPTHVGVPPVLWLLAHLDAPPDWLSWLRPAREGEGCDVVATLDLTTEGDEQDAGVARVGFAVRWRGEQRPEGIACWMVDREGVSQHGSRTGDPFVAWIRDIRRDLRRRHAKHGTGYTDERIHLLDPREQTHAPRRVVR